MRLCHSVWTKPMKTGHWDVSGLIEKNLWIFSLSVAYAKKLEVPIVLHTDIAGKDIFGFLPYDEIYLTLNDLNTPECFWAAGKIHAQSLEPLESIHLDGDVFLKKNELLDKLNFSDFDLLIQNTENNQSIYEPLLNTFYEVLQDKSFPIELNFKSHLAFNCGIIGFNNQQLKNKYIEGYKLLVNLCIYNNKFMDLQLKNKNSTPDLILEQWWLHCVSNFYPYKLKAIFPNTETLQQDAIHMGYTHLLGRKKYDLIEKVKDRLFEVNPVLYKKTHNQVSKL